MSDNEGILQLGTAGGDDVIKQITKLSKGVSGVRSEIFAIHQKGGLSGAMKTGPLASEMRKIEAEHKKIYSLVLKQQRAGKLTDEQAAKQLNQLRLIKEEYENVLEAANKLTETGDIPIPGLDELGEGLDEFSVQQDRLTSSLGQALQSTGQLSNELEGLSGAEKNLAVETLVAVGSIGQMIDTAGRLRTEMIPAGKAIYDVAEGAKELPGRLKDAIGSMGEWFQSLRAVKAGTTAAAAATTAEGAAAATATPSIWGQVAATVALNAPLVVVASALAGLIAIFVALKRASDEQRETIRRLGEERTRQMEREIELYRLRRDASAESIAAQQAELDAQRALQAAELANVEAQMAAYNQMYADAMGLQGVIERNVIASNVMPELETQAKSAREALEATEAELALLAEALPDVEVREAAENVAEAERELINVRNQMIDELEQYHESLQRTQDQWAFEDRRREEDQQRAEEQSEKDFQRRIADVERRGAESRISIIEEMNDSIADIEEQFIKSEADALRQYNKGLADLDEELSEGEFDLRESLAEEEAEMIEVHHRSMLKAEKDYQRERLRRLEDLNDALLEAEMNNDVVAFISAQKAAKKDLRRMDEDNSQRSQEEQEEFNRRRLERKEQFQEELQDLRENVAERRQEMIEQYNEERAVRAQEQAERISEIRIDAQERIAANKEAQAKEIATMREERARELKALQDDLALQARRRKEDRQRELQQMRAQTEARLEELAAREEMIMEVIRSGGELRLQEVERLEREMRATQVRSYKDALSQMNAAATSFSSGMSGAFGGIQSGINNIIDAANKASQAASSASSSWSGAKSSVSSGGWAGGVVGGVGTILGGGGGSASKTGGTILGGGSSGGSSSYGSGAAGFWDAVAKAKKGMGFAQEGAFVKSPSMFVAGEGGKPEIILPVDKSKGIPEEGWRALGETLSNGGFGGTTLNVDLTMNMEGGGYEDMRSEIVYNLNLMGQTLVKFFQDARTGQAGVFS